MDTQLLQLWLHHYVSYVKQVDQVADILHNASQCIHEKRVWAAQLEDESGIIVSTGNYQTQVLRENQSVCMAYQPVMNQMSVTACQGLGHLS